MAESANGIQPRQRLNWSRLVLRLKGLPWINSFLWLSAVPACVQAQNDLQHSDFSYERTENQVTITRYHGKDGLISIPETIQNESVKSIGQHAFWASSAIQSVMIPNGINSIADGAFMDCINLRAVQIPGSVTNIGPNCFNRCVSLEKVTIPNSCRIIGDYAFAGCRSLTNVAMSGGIIKIGESAFRDCTRLASITLSSDLTNIGNSCFLDCAALQSVAVPNQVLSIGNWAFDGCSGMRSLIIGEKVTSIGFRAFHGCGELRSVYIPNQVASVWDSAFENCIQLAYVVLGEKVAYLGDWAFGGCRNLTGVYFTGSAPAIRGSSVFHGAAKAVIYRRTGGSNWQKTFCERPTQVWQMCIPNNGFGFGSTYKGLNSNDQRLITNRPTLEVCTDLETGTWIPLKLNSSTNSKYFWDWFWNPVPIQILRFPSSR